MRPDLLAVARRHLTPGGTPDERNEGDERSPATGLPAAALSSYPSFLSSAPGGWGHHRAEVHRLLADADDLIETLGLPGTHPDVAAAAEVVASAVRTGDIETVRFATTDFMIVAKAIKARSQAHSSFLHRG